MPQGILYEVDQQDLCKIGVHWDSNLIVHTLYNLDLFGMDQVFKTFELVIDHDRRVYRLRFGELPVLYFGQQDECFVDCNPVPVPVCSVGLGVSWVFGAIREA